MGRGAVEGQVMLCVKLHRWVTHLSQVSVHVGDMVCVLLPVLWFAMNHTLPTCFVLFSVYFDVVRLLIMGRGVNRWLFILLLQLLHCGNFSHQLQVLASCTPHEALSPPPYNVSPATKTIGTHQQVCVLCYTCVEGVWLAVLVQN